MFYFLSWYTSAAHTYDFATTILFECTNLQAIHFYLPFLILLL